MKPHKQRASWCPFILLFLFAFMLCMMPGLSSAEEVYRFERMWPTLRQPWYFNGPTGVDVDTANECLYVADTGNNRIVKLTRDGSFITAWGMPGSGSGAFNLPHDVATDSDGNVYVADTENNRIQKFTADGTFITSWGSTGTAAGPLSAPKGIVVSILGDVYVADTGNNRIQHFTSDGDYIDAWGSAGTDNGTFQDPSGLAVNGDGEVYVADTGNHRIQKFTSDGTFVTTWGRLGSVIDPDDPQFNNPSDIDIDAEGNIYVIDTATEWVQKFEPDGTYLTFWGSPEILKMNSPSGIAVDDQGYVYIADTGNCCIRKFSNEESLLMEWGSGTGSEPGRFNLPEGIAQDANGYVYVADLENYRIQKFAVDGTHQKSWGGYGSDDGKFYSLWGLAVDSDNNIFVVDPVKNCVQVFTSEGVFVRKWGAGNLSMPAGIAIGPGNSVYITEWGKNRVQKFTREGDPLGAWGQWGTDPNQFWTPSGIGVDSSGNVYVADTFNHRIQKFNSNGGFIKTWGRWGLGIDPADPQFYKPYGLAVANSGDVYVADTLNHRIQKFTSDGAFVGSWGSLGAMPGQFNQPEGLAVSEAGGITRVFVSDKANNRVQVFKVVQVADHAKAIVVAGGGPYPGNTLWDATQVCTNFAYRALLHQGYTKESVRLLTPDLDLDLDTNGVFVNGLSDDVDGDATSANLQDAITSWAADADSLTLYLADHGGDKVFRMSKSEALRADDLAGWLGQLQDVNNCKVIVVYDACHAGSFLPELCGPNRIVMTSTSAGERAKFLGQGTLSFSSFFWSEVFSGGNIAESFSKAYQTVKTTFDSQTPLMDADNDCAFTWADFYATAGSFIGSGIAMPNAAPVIGEVAATQSTSENNLALLSASDIQDPNADGIARVWAVLYPPGYQDIDLDNPVLKLPTVELMPVAGGTSYEAETRLITVEGTYNIAFYAMDGAGVVSAPHLATLSVGTALARRAIIVASGDVADPSWPAIEGAARQAYEAVRVQGYQAGDIRFMTPATTVPDVVPQAPSLEALQIALTAWAAGNTWDLVLYLIGPATSEGFQIAAGEVVTPGLLEGWLNLLQQSLPGRLTFVYDADRAGCFIPQLIPPDNRERILVAGTNCDEAAFFSADGSMSFSRFFWAHIAEGASVFDAYSRARHALDFISQKNNMTFSCYSQTPLLDDTGDGVANEPADGRLSRRHFIGLGLLFGDDAPMIGEAGADDLVLTGGATTTILWARNVTATSPLHKVWAIIEPPQLCPDAPGSRTAELIVRELTYNSQSQRYELEYDGFLATAFGAYTISLYAEDEAGNVSAPAGLSVLQASGPDVYEDDDSYLQANQIIVNSTQPQTHNFDTLRDEDWVIFYGDNETYYTIVVNNLQEGCKPIIDLYAEDGSTLIDTTWGQSDNGTVYIDWDCPRDGFYYVSVWPDRDAAIGSRYDLNVSAEAPFPGMVAGTVTDARTGKPLSGVRITSNVGYEATTNSSGEYEMMHQAGSYQLTASAKDYLLNSGISFTIGDGEIVTRDIRLSPQATTTTTTSIPSTDTTTTSIPSGGGGGGGGSSGGSLPQPVLSIPGFLDMGTKFDQRTLSISSSTGGTLMWQLGTIAYNQGQGWITRAEPAQGEATSDKPGIVAITVARAGLKPGIYTAVLPISSNGGAAEILIMMEVVQETPTGQCLTNAECDDGVFCNGAEACDGVCVEGQAPCALGQLCVEEHDACWDVVTIDASPFGMQQTIWRPFFLAQRCQWLALQCARQPHFDAAGSMITIQGENDNCSGVACDEGIEPFQLADFIFIPVCIQRDATPGTWNITVQTQIENGSSGQMEFVNASFEVR